MIKIKKTLETIVYAAGGLLATNCLGSTLNQPDDLTLKLETLLGYSQKMLGYSLIAGATLGVLGVAYGIACSCKQEKEKETAKTGTATAIAKETAPMDRTEETRRNIEGLVATYRDNSRLGYCFTSLYDNPETGTLVGKICQDNFAANQRCGWTGDVVVKNAVIIATPRGYNLGGFLNQGAGMDQARGIPKVTESKDVIEAVFDEGKYVVSVNKKELTPFSREVKEQVRRIEKEKKEEQERKKRREERERFIERHVKPIRDYIQAHPQISEEGPIPREKIDYDILRRLNGWYLDYLNAYEGLRRNFDPDYRDYIPDKELDSINLDIEAFEQAKDLAGEALGNLRNRIARGEKK